MVEDHLAVAFQAIPPLLSSCNNHILSIGIIMRIFGIDGGIASIGWAVLDIANGNLTICGAGVRMFDAPETNRERTPTNAVRRLHRGQRRVIRRRRERMAKIKRLFQQHGLLATSAPDALKRPGL